MVRTAHPGSAWVPVSPEPSGDSLWLSMALLALGLDPWSLLCLFLFQLFLAWLPLTAGGSGQGPLPRVTFGAGECLMARHGAPAKLAGQGREGWRERGEKGYREVTVSD